MSAGFGARLAEVTAARGRLCVGVDPHPALLQAWGLDADARGLERFARGCVDALGDLAGLVKPQSAFFERYGSAGVAVLERVLADCRDAGALSVLDVKRGDIGSTMSAYAEAYLADGAPLAADAVTASPYLGFGALEPAVDLARRTGRGVFVLARTSNPEGAVLQRAAAQTVVDGAAAANADGSGTVGVVVGATVGDHGLDLSHLAGPVLAPGFGAQGATARDLRTVFGDLLPRVLPVSARAVLRHGPDRAALRAAYRSAAAELAA